MLSEPGWSRTKRTTESSPGVPQQRANSKPQFLSNSSPSPSTGEGKGEGETSLPPSRGGRGCVEQSGSNVGMDLQVRPKRLMGARVDSSLQPALSEANGLRVTVGERASFLCHSEPASFLCHSETACLLGHSEGASFLCHSERAKATEESTHCHRCR